MLTLNDSIENPALPFLGLSAVLLGVLWLLNASWLRALRRNKETEIEALQNEAQTLRSEIRGCQVKFAPTFDQEGTVARLKEEEADLTNKMAQFALAMQSPIW